ncbi:MAG: imelysin family protein [Bacteroidota bacterium]
MIIATPLKTAGFFLLITLTIAGLMSCDGGIEPDPDLEFDRASMLTQVADELIIVNFGTLQLSVTALSDAIDRFTQDPTEGHLMAARTAWVQTAIDHQHCSAFGFGPASLLLGPYAEVLGAFPIDENKVELNILNPDFDLDNSFDKDVRGLYGIEYLLYGNGSSDAEIVAAFDQNRKAYLLLITAELTNTIDNIYVGWVEGYRQEFITSNGTASGSSISLYYNEFVKDYENLKNFKLELPGGLAAGQSGPDGTLVEAFYSGISRDLIVEQFENSKNIYFGLSRGGREITGFDEYLATVVGGPELVTQTKQAVTVIDNAIANIPQGRLSEHVGDPSIKALRDELQSNTANFKSSLSSLLGIDITFDSGDGD